MSRARQRSALPFSDQASRTPETRAPDRRAQYRDGLVRADPAGSGRGGGENHRRRGIEELAPVMFADRTHLGPPSASAIASSNCQMSRRIDAVAINGAARNCLPISFVGDYQANCCWRDRRCISQEHNDPQHRHDESQRQTARKHQYVNQQNVDDDRSE